MDLFQGGNQMSNAVHRQFMLASLRFLLLSILIIFGLGFADLHFTSSAYAASRVVEDGGISWPQNQVLPTFAQPHALDVVDLRQASNDVALTLSTLEGIVNRQEPRIYLLQSSPDEGYFTWLNETKIPYTLHTDPWEVLAKYQREV